MFSWLVLNPFAMNRELKQLCVSFLVGDRGSRTQDVCVELQLREKTDRINRIILQKKHSIMMYIRAKAAVEYLRVTIRPRQRFTYNNWTEAKNMWWSFVVGDKRTLENMWGLSNGFEFLTNL